MLVNQLLQWVIELFGGSHFDVNFDGSVPAMLKSIINLIAYVLPLDVIIQIIAFTIGLYVLRLLVALLKTTWSILPLT